jgi:cytidine deaminase
MKKVSNSFDYEVYSSIDLLNLEDKELLIAARSICKKAYAPYSSFFVGAAARLSNGVIITGTNQENASFPAGICAERTLLAAASSVYPEQSIVKIAVSYEGKNILSDHPISPCGVCRQFLAEYETRVGFDIMLILGGQIGDVIILPRLHTLLPLAFTANELPKLF